MNTSAAQVRFLRSAHVVAIFMIIAITQRGHNASHSQNVSAATRTASRTALTLNKIIFLSCPWLSTLSVRGLAIAAAIITCCWWIRLRARSCSRCCAMRNGKGCLMGPCALLWLFFNPGFRDGSKRDTPWARYVPKTSQKQKPQEDPNKNKQFSAGQTLKL